MAVSVTFSDIVERCPDSWDLERYEFFYLQYLREKGDFVYYTDVLNKEIKLEPINHMPLKEYEVWSEGYRATGESGDATLHGKAKARNFGQACDIVFCKERLEWIEKVNDPSYVQYEDYSRWDYDSSAKSYWGCRLFWNEVDARRSFG